MIRWDLQDYEVGTLRNTLQQEVDRLNNIARAGKKTQDGRILELTRLLNSLNRAANSVTSDLICYCDTNYDFQNKTLSISFRIGDEPTIHRESFGNIQAPPDEYLGIMAVLKELQKRKVSGRIQIICDAARCAIALQMGLRHKVSKHSVNQSPRSVNFGFSYDDTIKLTKELLENGCQVEFSYKHRGYINEALKLA